MKISIFYFLFFFVFASFTFGEENKNIYILSNSNYQNIPRAYFQFLEGKGSDISLKDLNKANWNDKLESNQSYFDGFWVKLILENRTDNLEFGIHHNWNFEKKLIFSNSKFNKTYEILKSSDENYIYRNDNRIWFDYKIILPKGEKTIIYDYFRSNPMDRLMTRPNGLDKIDIASWEEIDFRLSFRTQSYFVYISVIFFFGMYFIFYFFISKEKSYLWISLLLFSILYPAIGFLFSNIYGIRFNYMYGPAGYSLVSIIVIEFFRNILITKENFPRIDKYFKYTNVLYLIFFVFYAYDALDYPNGEYFKNLIKYPYSMLGPGTIPLYISFIPILIIGCTSIILSYILWKKGDTSAKYLFLSFFIPVFIPIINFGLNIYGNQQFVIELYFLRNVISMFFLLFMPVVIGLALAERVNQFKRESIQLLEEKVLLRTSELSDANQSITQSVNSASIIQNAILPKIDCNKYGFREFEYLWEPRDIVGGDFYWLDKHEDWTSFVVADCTGHGIPGAFMTLISSTLLDRVKSLDDLSRPDVILNQLDELLESKLRLKENKTMEFGMDIGICSFSQKNKLLRFSGAKMNLYKIVDETVNEFKGNKISIGYSEKPHPIELKNHEIDLSENPNFYIFSDGVTDQVGGSKKLMYGKKRLLKHINHSTKIKTVIQNIKDDFNDYQKDNSRRDDLSLFGFSIA